MDGKYLSGMFSDFKPLELKKEFLGVRLPKIEIDKRYYDELKIPADSTNTEFLKSLCSQGFKRLVKEGRIDIKDINKYRERVAYELETLDSLKVVDYILMVWDVINFCKKNDIPTGPGRGSAAGVCVNFLIGITDVDPIKHNLFFERFISPSRVKSEVLDGEVYLTGAVPDIDEDLCFERRQEVIKYVEQKYLGRVSKIINLSTLTGKNLIKECGKAVSGKSEQEMNEVSGMVPTVFGTVQDIEETYKENPKFKEWCDENQEAYHIALSLRGLIKNKSVHASGIVVAPDEIFNVCPVEMTKDGHLVSGFDMNDVGSICIKLDLLGLKTLTVIDGVCKLIGKKMSEIDVNHPSVYDFLQEFQHSYGIFQLEAGTAEKVTQLIKPKNLDEVSAVLAIGRPGAMSYVSQYVDNKNRGYGDVIDPIFEDVLKDTYQIPIFQESLMALLNKIGFSLEESYAALKVVSKKKREEVAEWKDKIFSTASKNNISEKTAEVIFKLLDDSASYSFNKCLGLETIVEKKCGSKWKMKDLKIGDKIKSLDLSEQKDIFVEVIDIIFGEREMYEVVLEDGRKIECSMDHKFLCSDFIQRPLREILERNLEIITDGEYQGGRTIPKNLFNVCLVDKKSNKEISQLYPTRRDGAYYLNKFINYLLDAFNMGLVEYCETYLNIKWPRCPVSNERVGFKVSGKGVHLSKFKLGCISKEHSPKFKAACEKSSIERQGKGNPMYGKKPWQKRLDKNSEQYKKSIEKLSNSLKGKTPSEETRMKQSESAKRRKIHGHTGRKHSPETIELLRRKTASLYSNGVFANKRVTSIHTKVKDFLETLTTKCEYSEEFLFDFYSLDFAFVCKRIAIECNGTYFHIDPRFYPNGPKDAIQRKNHGRDKRKKKYLESKGWIVIYLWETEINNEEFKEYLVCELKKLNLLKN